MKPVDERFVRGGRLVRLVYVYASPQLQHRKIDALFQLHRAEASAEVRIYIRICIVERIDRKRSKTVRVRLGARWRNTNFEGLIWSADAR